MKKNSSSRSREYTRTNLESGKLELTAEGRHALRDCYMATWHERGEHFNRGLMAGEVVDVWFEAVRTFLAFNDNLTNGEKEGNDGSDS